LEAIKEKLSKGKANGGGGAKKSGGGGPQTKGGGVQKATALTHICLKLGGGKGRKCILAQMPCAEKEKGKGAEGLWKGSPRKETGGRRGENQPALKPSLGYPENCENFGQDRRSGGGGGIIVKLDVFLTHEKATPGYQILIWWEGVDQERKKRERRGGENSNET